LASKRLEELKGLEDLAVVMLPPSEEFNLSFPMCRCTSVDAFIEHAFAR
jgi:hypothetical protein